MKLSASAISGFIKSPDPKISVILLYGPDHGLVTERTKLLEQKHLGADSGPFSHTFLSQDDLKSDPAILQDSLSALPLGGGKCVVRLKTTADQAAKVVKGLLDALNKNELRLAALLLIEAGDLGPRSSLRKSIEQDRNNAITVPCYAPGLADLRTLALEDGKSSGLGFADGALDVLTSRLPQDRALARSEIEKLMLYAANNEPAQIDVADVLAVVTDSLDQNLDAFVFALADQNNALADQQLTRAKEAGQSPIAMLRAIQRHFMRLSEARTVLDQGQNAKAAMANLRPPVFFIRQQHFSRQLSRWSAPALGQVLSHSLATERAIKSSGALPDNLLARLVIKVCASKNA
ncbi:MAG: DNA polymerase III subunit delta [Robiginitomaculum sp.]|nr:MAG: DNA polymerase III subunit delta [Robiginitomaculum sp.]